SSREKEFLVSKVPEEIRFQEYIFTILGLVLLSVGIFTAFLLNVRLGIFFVMGGTVMTMIGVAFPPKKKLKREKQEKEPEKAHSCPKCNKEISENFKICPYCRFNLKSRAGAFSKRPEK
ncbi:MAG: zinc-ribbon domain-containing protein, partial [Candidatus Bathyarchaeota archaeon]